MKRIIASIAALFIGGLAALVAIAPAAQVSGGFPSRPRFQSVGIGIAAPATGRLYISGQAGTAIALLDGSGNSSFVTWRRNSSSVGDIGSADSIYGAGATTDFAIGTRGTGGFAIATGASATERFRISDTGQINVPGTMTFGSAPNFQNATTAAQFNSTAPRILWNDTDAGANEKLTQCGHFGTVFECATRTDADGTGTPWLTVTRSGTSVSEIALSPVTDVAARGVEVFRTKTADTARSSTTTLSNDPHMVYAIPSAGTYRFRVYMQVDGTTTGTQGISFNVNYSGTFTSPGSHWMGFRHCSGAVATGGAAVASAVTTAQQNCGTLNTTDSDNAITMEGVLIATGTGNLAVAWAQQVSNANATNVRDGSHLAVTRIL